MTKKWNVNYTDEFGAWWQTQIVPVQEKLYTVVSLLEINGPKPMIHKFDELRAGFTLEQRTRLDQEVAEMNREYVLSQIRNEVGLTQQEVAERLDISQPAYAAYEKADNMRIGTLRKIITALGGKLSFNVNLDGHDYLLQMPQQMAMA